MEAAAKWRKAKPNHPVAGSLRCFPSGLLELSESATCCSRPILKLLMGKNPMVTLGQPLVQVITPRGPILVSRKIGDEGGTKHRVKILMT